MARITEIAHPDRKILLIDFSGLKTLPELEEVALEGSRAMERLNGEAGLLILVDMTGVPYTLRTFRRLSEIAAGNAPHVHARALVGLGPGYQQLVETFGEFSDREVAAFDDRQSALDWLTRLP